MPTKLLTFCTLMLISFVLLACTKKSSPPTETAGPITKQVGVLLKEKTNPTALMESLKEYEASAKGPTSRSKNQWLISYNSRLIQPEEILAKIKAHPTVIDAEIVVLQTKE